MIDWDCVSKPTDEYDEGGKNWETKRNLTGLIQAFVRVLGYDCVVTDFVKTLRARALELAFQCEDYDGDVSLKLHTIYQAVLQVTDEYNHELALGDVKKLDKKLNETLVRVADLKRKHETEKDQKKRDAVSKERERREIAKTSEMNCTACQTKHDSHSRLCIREGCGRKYCR